MPWGGKASFPSGSSCPDHASAVQLKCKEDRLAQEKSMPVRDSPWRGRVTAGWVPRNGNEDASIPLLSHHTCPALSPTCWGPPPSVSSPCVLSLICCPSHFLPSISLHSNSLSRYLDLFFILILTCSHSPVLSHPLPVCPPLSSAMCPWKSQSCRQSFLDRKPAVATFSTPAPLPVQVLSRTGYSSFSGVLQSANNVTTRMNRERLVVATE